MTDLQLFAWFIGKCKTVAAFNTFIVPLMKVLPAEMKKLAAEEAKERGYRPNKELGIYEETK